MIEAISGRWCHISVDMQLMFWPGTDWGLTWMPRVLPQVSALCQVDPSATIFTRFIPARRPGEGQGLWRQYYERWAHMTIEQGGTDQVELLPELREYAPPALVLDKPVYSPWLGTDLRSHLQARSVDTLIVTGGETDMCVLATVLGAVDWGYRTILVQDAVCSASDEAHDAMLALFSKRYRQHVETATTDEILAHM
jgi:nicotinamidase-related amidase